MSVLVNAHVVTPPPPPPPPPGPGNWTQLNTGGAGFDGGAYWLGFVVNKTNGKVLCPGFNNTGTATSLFNPATGLFEVAGGSNWGNIENYSLIHDPARSQYIINASTPSNANFHGGDTCAWSDSDPGAVGGTTDVGNFAAENGGFGLFGNIIVSVASFSSGPDTIHATTLPGYGIAHIFWTGTPPPDVTPNIAGMDWGRLTHVDTRNGNIYVFAPDSNVYKLTVDYSTGNGVWTTLATTGTPPPYTTCNMAVDENANRMCVWCGIDAWVTDAGTQVPIRQTWTLDLTTLAWALGPNGFTGTAPAAQVACYNRLIYDSVHFRIVGCIGGTSGLNIWSFS